MQGKILYDLRVKKGFTQQQVADALGITRQTYNRYEKDLKNITITTLIKIFNIIGATNLDKKEFCNKITKL